MANLEASELKAICEVAAQYKVKSLKVAGFEIEFSELAFMPGGLEEGKKTKAIVSDEDLLLDPMAGVQ